MIASFMYTINTKNDLSLEHVLLVIWLGRFTNV